MAERTHVRKRKWPRLVGEPVVLEWEAEVLGRDDFGTWLLCPAGAVHRRSDGDSITLPCAGVQLMPAGGWWAAWWWQEPRWIGVDISTPPEHDGARWSYTDLELDLARLADGSVCLVDRDEFEEVMIETAAPELVVRSARQAAALVEGYLRSGAEPFADAGWQWLDRAMSQ